MINSMLDREVSRTSVLKLLDAQLAGPEIRNGRQRVRLEHYVEGAHDDLIDHYRDWRSVEGSVRDSHS